MPGEIAKPNGTVVLDEAGHSDGNSLDARHDKIDADLLRKCFVKLCLVVIS